jgi:hypothetical protein
MQTSFELAGVPRKSLDRNDSPNTDVTWTDGLHASVRVVDGWRQHLVLQRNGSRGPSNVVRRPLDITRPDSRVTVFTAVELEGRWGPFIQREIDLTWIPGAVPGRRCPGASPGDYIALVLRGAVQPGLTVLGGRVVLGSELGAAFGHAVPGAAGYRHRGWRRGWAGLPALGEPHGDDWIDTPWESCIPGRAMAG